MPYTPPSQQQSPASSTVVTPGYSRSHSTRSLAGSHHNSDSPSNNGRHVRLSHSPVSSDSRPQPPRSHSSSASTDYLSKDRRSPAFGEIHSPTSAKLEYARAMAETHERNGKNLSLNTSIRQSPPPRSDNSLPVGMLVSPPDSTQNSSDDETPQSVPLEHDSKQLVELQRAVRQSLSKESRPTLDKVDALDGAVATADFAVEDGGDKIRQQPSLQVPQLQLGVPRQSTAGRKISLHSRSHTESAIIHTPTTGGSDESDEEDDGQKPPLIRKKSGELVKPAIRPRSRRRHSSMPGTPTYSKAVHFNDNIEQVRHFLQVDRPIAVSAGGSPVDTHDDQTEFPFGSQAQPEWEIRLANFPRESLERSALPVWVEKLYLSADQKCLIGTVAVANLAFHKVVHARFTFDSWKTTSEVMAEFNNDPRQQARNDGYDQFNFNIKLADQRGLETKTLLLCMRYAVNGQEYWDNNGDRNYQIEFKKKPEPPVQVRPRTADGTTSLGSNPALPRSRHNSPAGRRPRSMPSFDDDFSSGFDGGSYFDLRRNNTLAKKKSFDNPPVKVNPSGQQFGSRYDFGASLTAALNQAQASMGVGNAAGTESPQPRSTTPSMARVGLQAPANSGADSPRPDTLLASRQSLDSQAYQDFVSRFCFFGSGKPVTSPEKPSPLATSDGANDKSTISKKDYKADCGSVHHEYADAPIASPRIVAPGGCALQPSPRFADMNMNGSGMESPEDSSYGFPFYQKSGFFTPESRTSSVSG